jgi:hypothetical protein
MGGESLVVPKVTFNAPKANKIVILDAEGSEIIGRMVLKNVDYEVLPSRGEVVFITWSILILMLKNLRHIDWIESIRKGKIFGRLYLVNLLSCLHIINPSVVATFIDNTSIFHWLSIHYKKAKFIAIQNGTRNNYNVSEEHLPRRPEFGSIITIPHYYCFGQYEIDLFKKYHHHIKNYYAIGSLRGGYYLGELYTEMFNDLFDVCLVSDWIPAGLQYLYFQSMREATTTIARYLGEYQSQKKIKLCVAMRSNDSEEREYYQEIFGRDVYLMSFDGPNMSTYRAMNSSTVIVNCFCTAVLEALGWGKKVLFCNYMGDDEFDLPGDGICLLKEKSYNAFEQRLDDLLRIDPKEYAKIIIEWQKYHMNFSPERLPHHVIRKAILDHVKNE